MTAAHGHRAWRDLAARVVREEPLCRIRIPGICTTVATCADHMKPRSRWPDLALERDNVQGACAACNRTKSDLTMDELRAKLELGDETPAKALEFFS